MSIGGGGGASIGKSPLCRKEIEAVPWIAKNAGNLSCISYPISIILDEFEFLILILSSPSFLPLSAN